MNFKLCLEVSHYSILLGLLIVDLFLYYANFRFTKIYCFYLRNMPGGQIGKLQGDIQFGVKQIVVKGSHELGPRRRREELRQMRKTDSISFHLAKNTTALKMKTMNDGNTKKMSANKPHSGCRFCGKF